MLFAQFYQTGILQFPRQIQSISHWHFTPRLRSCYQDQNKINTNVQKILFLTTFCYQHFACFSLQILNQIQISILANQKNQMFCVCMKYACDEKIQNKLIVRNYYLIVFKNYPCLSLVYYYMLTQKVFRKAFPLIKPDFLSGIGRLINNKSSHYFSTVKQYDPKTDYYKRLELTQSASSSEIKQSFYQMAKKYHPDSHSGYQQHFKAVNQAYNVLSNEQLRKQYDSARQNLNIGQQRQKIRQQSTKSYYNHSGTNWAYVRRGKTFYYDNPDGSYSRKTYGYRNAGTYGESDQAFQMEKKFKMFEQAKLEYELQSRIAFIRQQSALQRTQMRNSMQTMKIIKKMEKQYQQRQNKIFQSTLLYRMITYIRSKAVESYVWIIDFLSKSKK